MESWNDVFNGQFSTKLIKSNEKHDDDWIAELKANVKILQDNIVECQSDLCDIRQIIYEMKDEQRKTIDDVNNILRNAGYIK